MPINAELLLDTSAAIALVTRANAAHAAVVQATRGRTLGLAGHAQFETFSVLTRLPGLGRLSAEGARRVIDRAFPYSVALSTDAQLSGVAELVDAGIAGGAVYDGLVGLAAREAGIQLFSLDHRAAVTYQAIGASAWVM